jgi:hypothetical protein
MSKPHAIDLFCGLGGWTDGFLAEGYDVTGYDIEAHDYGTGGYPAELVLRDVLTIDGSEFADASVILASPPCQRYSYMAMPWKRAKAQAAAILADSTGEKLRELNALFDACFRIQREASAAAGRHIPLIVENVRGAEKWVGHARWHFGSFYLWGDVPALMPKTFHLKNPGRNFHYPEKYGIPSPSFHGHDGEQAIVRAEHIKNEGGSWFAIGSPGQTDVGRNPVKEGRKVPGIRLSDVGFNVAAAQRFREGVKAEADGKGGYGGSFGWDGSPMRRGNSKSDSRKAASAMIAKIPLALSSHIARVYHPGACV